MFEGFVGVIEPDLLKICFLLGITGKNIEKGELKEGIAYLQNGMIMFLNGNHLWITKANSFTEKALERIGYTINSDGKVWVPDLKAGHATNKLRELVEQEIMAGNIDRQSIVEKVSRNEEIRFALAFTSDPLLNDEQKISQLMERTYGGMHYGNINRVVNEIYRQSKFFNVNEYLNTTFYEYCLPIIDNMLEYYSQNMPDINSNSPKKR